MNLYFIAMLVSGEEASAIRSMQEEMCRLFDVCQALKSPPHITLIPPFRQSERDEGVMKEFLRSFKRLDFSTKAIKMNHFDDRVIYIEIEELPELKTLQKKLRATLIQEGMISQRTSRRFNPHITVGHRNLQPVFTTAWDHFSKIELDLPITLSGPVLLKHDGKRWNIVSEN